MKYFAYIQICASVCVEFVTLVVCYSNTNNTNKGLVLNIHSPFQQTKI